MKSNPVSVNANIQGGTPCFAGTRVPAYSLFDHLEQGFTVDEFLEDFPTVSREQVTAALEFAKNDLLADAVAAP